MKDIYDNPNAIYHYQYKSDIRSITNHIMKYLWKAVLYLIPKTMSANTVTLIGNIGSILSLVLLAGYAPKYGITHPWIFPLAGFSLLFYNTLDNVDGQQARRTNSSGPQGEFFDHWLDAFNVYFMPLGIAFAFPIIPMEIRLAIVVAVLASSWLAYREVQITNILYAGPLSAQEIITISWVFLIVVGYTGYEFWSLPHDVLGFPPVFIIAGVSLIGTGITMVTSWWRIRLSIRKEFTLYLLTLLPLMVWIIAVYKLTQNEWLALWGLLVFGFASARMTIDVIRVRLFGLRPRHFYPGMFSAAWLSGITAFLAILMPNTFLVFTLGSLILFSGVVLIGVGYQIYMALKRVKDYLGIPLLYNRIRHGAPKTQAIHQIEPKKLVKPYIA